MMMSHSDVQSAERICSLLSLHHQQASLSASIISVRGWGAPQLPLKTQHTHLTTRSTPFHILLPLSPTPLLLSLLYWSVRSPTQTTDSWTECHVTSRCNYSAPSIHLPPISRSDRRQLLSRLPSQPPNLSPGNLGSVGCRPVISPSRRGPYQAEGSPNRWGG